MRGDAGGEQGLGSMAVTASAAMKRTGDERGLIWVCTAGLLQEFGMPVNWWIERHEPGGCEYLPWLNF